MRKARVAPALRALLASALALWTGLPFQAPAVAEDDVGGSFRVEVVDERGSPVPGARVFMADAPAPCRTGEPDPLSPPLTTDASGAVDIAALVDPLRPRGVITVTLVGTKAGFTVATAPLSLASTGAVRQPNVRTLLFLARARDQRVFVRRHDEAPVAGARVIADRDFTVGTIDGRPHLVPVSAETDASGLATLPGVRPEEPRFRITTPPGLEWATCSGVRMECTDALLLRLPPTARFRCRVHDASGTPLTEAEVSLRVVASHRSPGTPVEATLSGRTDASGDFITDALPGGVVVVARAAVPHLLPFPAPGESPVPVSSEPGAPGTTTVVLREGAVFSGRVVDDLGDAVPGATLRLRSAEGRWFQTYLPPARSGDDGAFHFPAVPPGPALLKVEGVTARLDVDPERSRVTIPSGGLRGFDVRLHRPGFVRGVVVDTEGRSVANLPVMIAGTGGIVHGSGFTDADGRFSLEGVFPGEGLYASVVPPGRARVRGGRVDVAPGATTDGVRIEIPAAARLEGRLWRLDGGDPAACTVLLVPGAAPVGGTVLATPVLAQVVPLADGSFRFEGLDEGPWSIAASTAGPWNVVLASVDLAPGERRTLQVLELPRGRRLDGIVRDVEGRPIVRAPVELVALTSAGRLAGGGGRLALRTDAKGAISARDVPRVPMLVRLQRPDAPVVDVKVPADVDVFELRLRSPEPFTVRVVEDATGEPVAGALLRSVPRPGVATAFIEGRSGEDGVRLVAPAAEGIEALLVEGPRFLHVPVRVSLPAPGETVEVRLSPGARIAGRIEGLEAKPQAAGPAPVVQAWSAGPEAESILLRETRANPDGSFLLTGLPQVRCRVVVQPWEGETATHGSASVEVDAGKSEPVRLKVAPWSPVRGKVIGPDGALVTGAGRVTAVGRPREGQVATDVVLAARTDGGGHFATPPLDPDRHWRIETRGFAGRADGVTEDVRPGKFDVEVTLPAARLLQGRIQSPGGEPRPGVRVRAVRVLPSGTRIQVGPLTATDAEGRFRLEGVPALDLRVEAITDTGPVDVGAAPAMADADGVFVLP